MKILPGKSYPLGATWDGMGVNFALFSENATRVELCLFDSAEATEESVRLDLPEQTEMVWHGYISGLRPGQAYGYRVHGPWDPANGHRFNRAKVLLDPYARALARPPGRNDEVFGYKLGTPGPNADLVKDERDSAPYAPLGVVIDPAFTWGDDRRPDTPWHRTVIYELHVRGLTKLHPRLPEKLRGTYAALAHDEVLRHLQKLGVTAVELMPVHYLAFDRHLVEKGLVNYWGYNSLSFFAPEARYSSDRAPEGVVREFKTMVRALHDAGIEVILDVVYNHTAEGNHLGPTYSLRGVDNATYYRLAQDKRYYMDFTGTGNTLNMRHPRVLQLVMDSLRHAVEDWHVDGFRFDLASALARSLYEVDQLGSFFTIIHQDPVLSRVKLIAEPWDVGPGGYQVGNFPVLWTEWNGKYRDAVRRFWRGDDGLVGEMSTRLAGSADLYGHSGRKPYASINFVTCHDGFTLRDLVGYEHKHNEANGEDNRDGENHNNSWNNGVEGPSDDPVVRARRDRDRRNLFATLLLSQGVPMIGGGDELGRTQRGNNNAYCQDNEISWTGWALQEEDERFLDFARRVVRLRREHPVLSRRRFFRGGGPRGEKDLAWLQPSGEEMTPEAWGRHDLHAIGARLAGGLIDERDEHGRPVVDDTLVLLFNTGAHGVLFHLPARANGETWERILDTTRDRGGQTLRIDADRYFVEARSLSVLRLVPPESD